MTVLRAGLQIFRTGTTWACLYRAGTSGDQLGTASEWMALELRSTSSDIEQPVAENSAWEVPLILCSGAGSPDVDSSSLCCADGFRDGYTR